MQQRKGAYRVYEMFHALAVPGYRLGFRTMASNRCSKPMQQQRHPQSSRGVRLMKKNGSMKAAIEKVMTDEKFWHH